MKTKDAKNDLDIRHLMIDDWVIINGRPCQISTIAGKVEVQPEMEVVRSKIMPLPIMSADLDVIMKRLKKFDGFSFTYRPYNYEGWLIDFSYQQPGEQMRYISLPIKYYHEMQHIIRLCGCKLNVNYHWSHIEEKEENCE